MTSFHRSTWNECFGTVVFVIESYWMLCDVAVTVTNHLDRNRHILRRGNRTDCVTSRILSLVLENQLICARVVARYAACRTAISVQTVGTTSDG